jgi:hypothetical protein
MLYDPSLTTGQLLAVFTDEVTSHQGQVTDTADDGRRLLARSILPCVKEVRPGDQLQGGVAIRTSGAEVWVHPYLFRLVCKNGAIMAQAIQTHHLVELDLQDPADALEVVREAVASCCAPEVFADTFAKVRTAQEEVADALLNLLPHLAGLNSQWKGQVLDQILQQFHQAGDRSRFGLANAVTATAREIRDPDRRWELEELGGAIAIGTFRPSPIQGPPAEARRSLVAVGSD